MTPYVNVDVKMSKDMLRALTLHEFFCIGLKIESVTEESVKSFLKERFNEKLANGFKPEFLFSSQVA